MQSKFKRLLLKATIGFTEHQKWPNTGKNGIISPIFTTKYAKLRHKMDLQQSSVCSEQNIYQSLENLTQVLFARL